MRKRALLSVSDKSGLEYFAKSLAQLDFEIISTGGTAKLLRDAGLKVTDISDFTGYPEILDGRVKTLTPQVHAGILFDRSNPSHGKQMSSMQLATIDLVCVNLYPFEKEVCQKNRSLEEAIEFIDVGGPTMLRAAAKNFRHCIPVCDPSDYESIISELDRSGDLEIKKRLCLAKKVFSLTHSYDALIADFFTEKQGSDSNTKLPENIRLNFSRLGELRYGENPQQAACLYRASSQSYGFGALENVPGKELSYNNILDLDAAYTLALDLPLDSVVIVKHTNPCGVASPLSHQTQAQTYQKALTTDPKSAFGGIVAINGTLNAETAKLIVETFMECVIANDFLPEAHKILETKKNLRIVKLKPSATQQSKNHDLLIRTVKGALLVQTIDQKNPMFDKLTPVTNKQPSAEQILDLRFAMVVAKHVKSNAIVIAKNLTTLAIGAGQMSRIDSARFACLKAKEFSHELSGSVMASDAFFPFADTVELAALKKISAIIQPGGSKRDDESVAAANRAGIAMVVTGIRHFKH